eukprot:tig00021168_g19099.t1
METEGLTSAVGDHMHGQGNAAGRMGGAASPLSLGIARRDPGATSGGLSASGRDDDSADAEMLRVRKIETILFNVLDAVVARVEKPRKRRGKYRTAATVALHLVDFLFLLSLTGQSHPRPPALL